MYKETTYDAIVTLADAPSNKIKVIGIIAFSTWHMEGGYNGIVKGRTGS